MKYLFYTAKKYSIPIIIPLIDFLKESGEGFALFASAKVQKSMPEEWENIPVITTIADAIAYAPDFVITPGNFVDFRIPGIKVQIFHGLGIEKASHYKIRHFFDVYLTSGPVVTERFNRLQERYKYFLVRETGWPKVDYILNYKKEGLKRQYGIEPNKKVILYAPTFSRKMESASALLPLIPQITRENEVWIIKFHELMKKEVKETLNEIETERIRIIDTWDITPLLHISDCLVSDTSSVLYESLIVNRPVITYKTLSRPEKGIDISDKSQLRRAVDTALKNGVTEENKKCLREVNPYLDGKIAQNVFRELSEIKEKDLVPKKHRKWNVFRKLQILYHEKFKHGYLR